MCVCVWGGVDGPTTLSSHQQQHPAPLLLSNSSAHPSFWIRSIIICCKSLCFSGRTFKKIRRDRNFWLPAEVFHPQHRYEEHCWCYLISAGQHVPSPASEWARRACTCLWTGHITGLALPPLMASSCDKLCNTCILTPTKAKHMHVLRPVHGKKKALWNKAVQFITPLHRTLKENSTGKQVLYLLNQLSRGEKRYRDVYRGTWSPVLQSDIQGGLSGGPKPEANGKKTAGKQFSWFPAVYGAVRMKEK